MRQSKVAIAFLILVFAGIALGADKKIIAPPATKPSGNYSQGILIDGTLYKSGLNGAGMSPADVVSVQVYLKDPGKFQRMNAVYTSHFKDPRPTRTTVVVAGLVGPGNIEITATARK